MPSVASLIVGSILAYLLLRPSKKDKHLPPGPPPYPIIGNIPSIPLHFQFTKWAKQYGDVHTVKLGSLTMIVMSSVEAIRHIIEKNTALTSDRTTNHFADLISEYQPQPYVVFTRYSDLWRTQRRAMHEMLRAQTCLKYTPIQKAETYQFAVELLKNPEPHPPPHLLKHNERWSEILVPGGQYRRRLSHFEVPPGDVGPVEEAREKTEGGLSCDSYLCRTLVEAGTDTSNAALQTFLMMMIAFPDEMKKVQLEIDSVVGMDRMPVLEDIDELPYVQAAILEALRLRPIMPMGVPHATTGVVNYNNYLIPEGAILVMNTWGIFHDETLFPNADAYNPERFINNPEGAKVVEYLFGAGRRVCPGNNFAKNGLHLTVMTLLWGFNIHSAGKVDLDAFQHELTTEPKPFKCDIKPRSAKHAEMILAEYQATRRDVMDFERDFSDMDKSGNCGMQGRNVVDHNFADGYGVGNPRLSNPIGFSGSNFKLSIPFILCAMPRNYHEH
ncbi:cytochrome P450 [Cyathus striatus]|nr:cytochrome P450 [Cyathus striatus]